MMYVPLGKPTQPTTREARLQLLAKRLGCIEHAAMSMRALLMDYVSQMKDDAATAEAREIMEAGAAVAEIEQRCKTLRESISRVTTLPT